MSLVKTAVFPVAGMGTRFLPITKAIPKEMLPIMAKPLIQYAVDEAVAAGIDHLIFVTSGSKKAIEDYFDKNYELEKRLESSGKVEALGSLHRIIPSTVTLSYIRQREPKGLGDAILTAKRIVGDNHFAVLLADDLVVQEKKHKGFLNDLVDSYSEEMGANITLNQVPKEETYRYGIADFDGETRKISALVEKPSPKDAPSNWAVLGRYVFNPEIFSYLEKTKLGFGGELQITDAISNMMQDIPVYGTPFTGRSFDCGSFKGFKEAIQYYAQHAL